MDKTIYILYFTYFLCTVGTFLQLVNGGLVGCYKENRRKRVYNNNPGGIAVGTVTRDKCMTICGYQHTYAALTRGDMCLCGDTGPLDVDPVLALEPSKCTVPCDGDATQTCGSATHVEIYEAIKPVTSMLAAVKNVVQIGEAVSLLPNVETAASDWQMRIDYDDGAGPTSYAASPATGLLTRSFRQAGRYSIGAYLTDKDNIIADTVSKIMVVVETPVSGVAITCPPEIATYELASCTIEVMSGTGMEVVISYNDGTTSISKSFTIADAREFSLGNSVQENILVAPGTLLSGSSTNGLVLHPRNYAKYSSTLIGFEYHAATTGTLTIFVYRPASPCGGNEYCPDTNSCVAPGTCGVSDCSGDAFCSDLKRCCSASAPVVSSSLFTTYTKLYTKTVSVVATGYQYIDVKGDALGIEPGDIIAHSTIGGAVLAQFLPATGEEVWADYYCTGIDGTAGPSVAASLNCVLQTEVHHLKAVVAQKTSIYVPLQLENPGVTNFQAAVSNREIPGSETQIANITVLEGVDQAILIIPGCIPANQLYTFQLEAFTGRPVTIDWAFGDGNTATETGVSTTAQTHTYTSTGKFNLTITISNSRSFKNNETEVCVQEEITNLALTTAMSYVEKGVLSGINLGMTSGSHYTCKLTISDGQSNDVVYTDDTSTPPNTDYMYTFTTAGDYTITAECSNDINTATAELSTTAIERISGLALDPPGAMAGDDFQINVVWSTGSQVSLTLNYDGNSKQYTIDPSGKSALSEVIPGTGLTGKHPISVTATNIINSETLDMNFTIEVGIINPSISCVFLSEITMNPPVSYVVIPTNSSVSCQVDMDNGTSVELTVEWGDGSAQFQHVVAEGDSWHSDPYTAPIPHTFTTPGTCDMYVLVANAFNSSLVPYTVKVMTSVDNVEMNNVLPVEYTPPAIVIFIFSITAGPTPNDVTCIMDWGDLHTDTYYDCDLNAPITHVYRDMPGELTMTYTIFNIVSNKTGSIPVSIVTPIRDMQVYASAAAAIVNVPIDLVVEFRRAPGAGILDLTFICDVNDVGSAIRPRKRMYDSPDGQDTEPCTYTTVGTFTALVIATSYFETVNTTYNVIVQNPVTEEFVVSTNSPMDYLATDCNITYSMTFSGGTLPSDPYVQFNYGDGWTSGPLSFTNPLIHSYQYSIPGHYTTEVIFFNLAKEITRKLQTGCYEDFSLVTMTVLREQFLPLGGPNLPGFGNDQNIFRTDEPLKLHLSYGAGTFVWYDIIADDGTSQITCNGTDRDVATLNIPLAGTFVISLSVSNPLYSYAVPDYTAFMMEPATNIVITDNDIKTKAYEDKTFEIQFGTMGTTICFAIDNGVDSNAYLYGNMTECQSDPVIWAAGQFVTDNITNPLKVTYQYIKEGSYVMTVEGYNSWNWRVSSTFHFIISGINCQAPRISVKHRAPLFNLPGKYRRSNRNRLVGITDIACPDTLNNVKVWIGELWDAVDDVSLGVLDLTTLPSAVNSELSIPPRFLTYGLYRFTYKVTMAASVEGEGFFGESETFVEIEKSDLVVQVYEGGTTALTKGPNVDMTLAPRDYSYDEDNPDEDFDSYTLKCRDLTAGETYPNPDVYFLVEDLAYLTNHTGGCFGKGPGYVLGFNGRLTFNTELMTPGHVYEIIADGYKDDRHASNTVFLEILHADPPEQTIVFKIPKICKPAADGKVFNPNTELGLIASPSCPTCPYKYLWEVHEYNYEYADVSDGWNILSYLPNFIEGIESDQLTIKTSLFDHYKDVERFQIRLFVTDTTTNVTSKAYQNLRRNKPPEGGNCTITPTNVTAGVTNCTISCDGFVDAENDIADYRIFCETSQKRYPVASGLQTLWENRQMPLGLEEEGFILQCYATVIDDLGGSGTYFIQEVQSNKMSSQDLKDVIAQMSTSQADKTKVLQATANLDEVTGFCSAMGTLFQQMSKTAEMEEYSNVSVAVHSSATGFGSTQPRPQAFIEGSGDKATIEHYEAERDSIVQVVNILAETVSLCTVASTKDIELTSAAIEMVCLIPENIARDAQGSFTDTLSTMMDSANDNWEDLTVEDFQQTANAVIGALGAIESAIEHHMDNPSNTDVEKESQDVIYFETNLNSPYNDVPILKDPSELLWAGKKIYQKKSQQDFASSQTAKTYGIVDKTVRILSKVKPKSKEPFEIKTPGMELKVYKNSAKDLVNKSIETSGGSVKLPESINDLFADEGPSLAEETMILESFAKTRPVATEASQGLVSKYSNTVSFSLRDKDGNKKKVKNLPNPIPITINRDVNAPPDDLKVEFANPEIPPREWEVFFYHTVNKPEKPSWTSMHLIFRPTNTSRFNQLLVTVSFGADMPDVEKENIEHVCMIPSHTDLWDFYGDEFTQDAHTCFVPASTVNGRFGLFRIGVRQLDPLTELNKYDSVASLKQADLAAWRANKAFAQNYKMDSFLASCAYQDDDSDVWRIDGVEPGPLTNSRRTQCLANHLTTFAGGWVVAPNTIDWNFIFSNADFFKNPTLYITEIVIVVSYILAMIWARRQDKQDVEKLGLAPLPDNDPRDKYYYEIFVSTGMRRNGGTESKVHFILSGEEDETEVRSFADSKRKIFARGNLDGFLMAVPSDLGHLMYLRIWHDNSGKSKAASWYLNHIIIRDIQTDKKYFFISNKWFAVEEDDGQVDRVIPVAGKEQMSEFGHLFRERASKNLTDGHLWFSVIARPPQSRFTRCQRVSCCLCLLFMTMLANAMFYQTGSSSANAYTFGPFALTPEQIFIGVASNIIIFPINFLIITLFRKSRPRKLRPSRVEEALKPKPDRTTSMTDVNPKMKSSLSVDRPGSSFLMEPTRSESSLSRPETSMSQFKPEKRDTSFKKKKKCQLPWWFTIIGWILLWLCVLVSAAFVTFYGIMFQDIKCKKWITSMLISFFTSVFLTQPIKVFLFAIVFSLIIKNPGGDDDEEEDEEECKISKEDELLHEPEETGFSFISPQKALYKPKPPDPKVLEAARQQRMKEIQMWAVIREIVFYAFFLWILMVISYKSISTESYRYKFSMQQVFILTNDTNHAFTKVKNTNDFWVWARSGMLRGLRAGPYYNNYPPFYMRGYINDKVSRLMGYATLRQVRVKKNTCMLPKEMNGVIPECNADYDIPIEDSGTYAAGWEPLTNPNDTREEYTYQNGEALNGYPYWGHMAVYGGGGYVVKLNGAYFDMIAQFTQLEQENWIDKYTRAVFLEFTVYNPSINLFSISTLLSEFQPSGGVTPSYRFEPCMLLPYMSSVLLFQIACEIMYFLFTLWFIIKEVRNLYRERWKYFTHFWNLVELCVIAMSVTAIVIYFYRLYAVNELTEYFKETHGNEYMKFQYVGYWTELFNYIIGFLVFFASMKFLKLLRFNKRISLLSDTLKNSGRDLLHFSVIFNIVFLAFMQMFYLVYVANLDTFRTFVTSCEAGIVMMMGKFDIYNMLAVNQWFTQIFIFLFVVTITFIIVNMFLSILNETFSNVRTDVSKQQNDYEIVDFMMGRFKMWTGLGRAPDPTINPDEMENERNRNYRTLEGQIDYFPNQIDRFLSSISNMYMERSQFDDFLRKGAYGKMAMKAQMADTRHPQPGPSGMSHPRSGRRKSSGRQKGSGRGMTDVQTD